MASITKGYTFGATEQVTNTKLHTLVDSATIDLTVGVALGTTTPSSGAFVSVTATGGIISGLLQATSGAMTSFSASGTSLFDILQSNSFNLVMTPSANSATGALMPFDCTRWFTLDLDGTTYYVPCASATA